MIIRGFKNGLQNMFTLSLASFGGQIDCLRVLEVEGPDMGNSWNMRDTLEEPVGETQERYLKCVGHFKSFEELLKVAEPLRSCVVIWSRRCKSLSSSKETVWLCARNAPAPYPHTLTLYWHEVSFCEIQAELAQF